MPSSASSPAPSAAPRTAPGAPMKRATRIDPPVPRWKKQARRAVSKLRAAIENEIVVTRGDVNRCIDAVRDGIDATRDDNAFPWERDPSYDCGLDYEIPGMKQVTGCDSDPENGPFA